MKYSILGATLVLCLTGCAVKPITPWQGKDATQEAPAEQFSQILAQAKALPNAEVTEGDTQTIIKVLKSTATPKAYDLYLFTKAGSYAHPAAAKVTFSGAEQSATNPDFHFIKVGDNPNFARFVREILLAGFVIGTDAPEPKS